MIFMPRRAATRWIALAPLILMAGCPAPETSGGAESGTGLPTTGSSSSGAMASADPTTGSAVTTASTTATTTITTTDPGTTTSSTTPSDGKGDCPPGAEGCPCDGFVCDLFLQCIQGTCVGEPRCDQPEGEPNDSEGEAIELAAAPCNDGPSSVPGAFEGIDQDWFTYQGEASMLGCLDGGSPSATVVQDEVTISVCIFLACTDGGSGTVSSCPKGTGENDSPEGLPGCCGPDTASLPSEAHECIGGDAIYLVSVQNLDEPRGDVGTACIPYDLVYDYSDL